ncbi:hypothetical protein [Dickeya undicola]|uniref:Uncharacterized protein n=1 Tax=Dickeya undicola TaxID=1577887 RepID=A0A3N0G047_9GAMM|nr:hypothetical protein [Dickeya undicola]RNM05845.1 hypothetical protein EF878_11445 [Dickeya undicola]
MTNLNYDPTDPDKMRLPVGKKCGDCAYIRRCKALFGHVETDNYCDFSPSRAVFSGVESQINTGGAE